MDRGRADEARSQAERLAGKRDITNEEYGAPDFILGALAAQAADAAGGKQRSDGFRLAALYLQRSRERGFPAHREATGLYLLGKSQFLCGRLDNALPVLEEALRQPTHCAGAPAHELELRGLLIETLAGVYPPELEKALAESQKLLPDPRLGDQDRNQALLVQARILFRMDRTRQCAALLDKLPDDLMLRGPIALLRGQLALKEVQTMKKSGRTVPNDAQASLQLAIDWFRKALGQSAGDNGIARQANYLIGVGLVEQGSLAAAVAQMERTVKLYPGSPEYIAALFQEGEIYRRMGRHGESVTAYKRLMSAYSHMDEFHNPWISAPQIQTTIEAVCRDYVKGEKYNTALLLAGSLAGPFPKEDSLKLAAEIYRTWGENLLEAADRLPPERAERLRKEARFALRRAGDSYTELAREAFANRYYPEHLWNAAVAYFTGHDFRSAARMFRMYLKNQTDPRSARDAEALVDLGEAEISLGAMDSGLEALQECMQRHPHDVAVYRAALLAHRAAIALGDLKQAEAYLQDNLIGEQLTPASKEWRDSLFALGDLLHLAGRDAEAIPRLEEALQRYPDAPQAVSTRYLLADSSRRLALRFAAGWQRRFRQRCGARARGNRPPFPPRFRGLRRVAERPQSPRRGRPDRTGTGRAPQRPLCAGRRISRSGPLCGGVAGVPVGGEPLCVPSGSPGRLFADGQCLSPHGPSGRGPHLAGAGPHCPAADPARTSASNKPRISIASNGANCWTVCAVFNLNAQPPHRHPDAARAGPPRVPRATPRLGPAANGAHRPGQRQRTNGPVGDQAKAAARHPADRKGPGPVSGTRPRPTAVAVGRGPRGLRRIGCRM